MKKSVLILAIVLIVLNLLIIDTARGLEEFKMVEVNPGSIASYRTGMAWSAGQWIIIFGFASLIFSIIILVSNFYMFKKKK